MSMQIITEQEFLTKLRAHQLWDQTQWSSAEQIGAPQLDLRDCIVSNIALSAEDIITSQFIRCHWKQVEFTNCDFSNSLFFDSTFTQCKFLSCTLVKAEFNGANCRNTD